MRLLLSTGHYIFTSGWLVESMLPSRQGRQGYSGHPDLLIFDLISFVVLTYSEALNHQYMST